jgi:plastocyanin
MRPKRRQIDTSADPVCGELNPQIWTEDAEGLRGGLANVLVYVESESLQTYNFEQPTSRVRLEHKGCRYEPHVLGIRVGQPLEIVNSDPTAHNTHPTPKSNPEWNQTQPPDSQALVKTLNKVERFIPFKDNQHPWEKAYVGVFNHPFFAVSDELGHFKMEGLPPGQYRVVAWHERFGEQYVDITFLPDEARELTFIFTAEPQKVPAVPSQPAN